MELGYSKFFSLLLFVLSFNLFADEKKYAFGDDSSCSTLKRDILKSKSPSKKQLSELETNIKKDDFCYQNLMGIMIYQGIYFTKDQTKAKKIFYQLADKNYPEAQFNFGWTLTKDPEQDPEKLIQYLTGVFIKNQQDQGSKNIAEKAVYLARKYLDSYPISQPQECSQEKCTEKSLMSHSKDRIDKIRTQFNKSIEKHTYDSAVRQFNENREWRENLGTVMAILSVGVLAYNLTTPSIPNTQNIQNINHSGSEWFKNGTNWNPLNLNQFPM
jgi:hypothetical protein